jgi:hypothetical protein
VSSFGFWVYGLRLLVQRLLFFVHYSLANYQSSFSGALCEAFALVAVNGEVQGSGFVPCSMFENQKSTFTIQKSFLLLCVLAREKSSKMMSSSHNAQWHLVYKPTLNLQKSSFLFLLSAFVFHTLAFFANTRMNTSFRDILNMN